MIRLEPYKAEHEESWNAFISDSKNATFMFDRHYMDYHKDRFTDCSLMFYDSKNKLIACLPANIDKNEKTVYSHQGLTYGGLLMSKTISATQVAEALDLALDYYKHLGATTMVYKPIPYIYNKYPSQEDLYFLFTHDAKLIARGMSQTIKIQDAIKFNQLRKRCVKKSFVAGNRIELGDKVDDFWYILDKNLRTDHSVKPVHSIAELQLLKDRFPNKIKHYVVKNKDGEVIGGTIIFDCGNVVHTQYISANDEGKQTGAFDYLIDYLLHDVYNDREYFDFGISTEHGGEILNEGLLFQKESFGGRGVCYDAWQLNLL